MEIYKDYKIKKVSGYEFYEIINKDGKYIKNATTTADAKEKIDLLSRSK